MESACAPSTNDLLKNLRNEGVTQILDKDLDVLKNKHFSIYFMLVAFRSVAANKMT